MIVSGLGRHLRGRDYLPRLGERHLHLVGRPGHGKMLNGQAGQGLGRPHRPPRAGLRRDLLPGRHRQGRAGSLLAFPRRDPLAVPLPALPIPDDADRWGRSRSASSEDGTPWLLKVHGTHVLIAGATGAGKGSILWSTIRGLLPAVRAGLVQVWALDPKLMELSFGRALFGDRYAADPADCADLLEAAVTVMQDRAARFAGVQRTHTPTVDDPFVLVRGRRGGVPDRLPARQGPRSSASRPRWPRSPPRAGRSASASWPRCRTRARRS